MKILLTHPYSWPYVRRGTERNMDVWLKYLVGNGHDARVLATLAERAPAPDARQVLEPRLWSPWMKRLRIEPEHTFFANVWRMLQADSFDVVHSYHFYDSLASTLQRGRGKPHRSIVQLNGVPVPGVSCRRVLPPEGPMIRRALSRADRVVTCSHFVREQIRRTYGAEAAVIAPPLDASMWQAGEVAREDPPVVLAVGNFAERRKGLRVLLSAFAQLHRDRPELVLRISGNCGALRDELTRDIHPELAAAIRFLGLGKSEDLPRLYQTASVLVLPSMWEPSGTVMMEAWLSGTPVVATRHGGLPEFFAPGVGAMFEPETEDEQTSNARGLASAIEEGLRLAKTAGIEDRCRAHGMSFSTCTLGPKFIALYREAMSAA